MKRRRLHKGNYLILAALLLLSWLTAACGSVTPTIVPVTGQTQGSSPTNTAQANPPTNAPNTVAATATAVTLPTATTAPTVVPTTAVSSPVTTQSVAPAPTTAKPQPAVGVQVGLTAPDFTAKLYTGEEVKLSQYKGKGVLLNFWATY